MLHSKGSLAIISPFHAANVVTEFFDAGFRVAMGMAKLSS